MGLMSKIGIRSRMQLYELMLLKENALRRVPIYKLRQRCKLEKELKEIRSMILN